MAFTLPPATFTVAAPVPARVICTEALLSKESLLAPILSMAAFSSIRSPTMDKSPLVFKLPLTVTLSRVPEFETKAVLSLL